MRNIRYQIASSPHRCIAGPNDEHDWIAIDPDIDFQALLSQYDTVLMGPRTFAFSDGGGSPGMKTYMFSRTLRQQAPPTSRSWPRARERCSRSSAHRLGRTFGSSTASCSGASSSWTAWTPLNLPSCPSSSVVVGRYWPHRRRQGGSR